MKNSEPTGIYSGRLAEEWIEWVESSNPLGGREKEIYPIIQIWLKKNHPKKLVDIGCGQGICSSLVEQNIEYLGIDPAKKLILRARKTYGSKTKQFLLGKADELPLSSNTFDGVMSIWVWSHLNDLYTAAKEMARVLVKGGNFLVVTANPQTYDVRKSFYKRYEEREGFLIGDFDLGNDKYLTNTTLYYHSKENILNAIVKGGLKMNKVETSGLTKQYPGGLNLVIEGVKV